MTKDNNINLDKQARKKQTMLFNFTEELFFLNKSMSKTSNLFKWRWRREVKKTWKSEHVRF